MNNIIIVLGLVALTTFLSCGKDKQITGSKPPVVNAGGSITAVAGCNKILLEVSYINYTRSIPNLFWKQVSGPTASVIVDPNKITTLVTNVGNGTYRFVLQVTDEIGTATDTVTINIVNAKEITVPNLFWSILMDDITPIYAVSLNRPDIFCDTLQIKQIAVNGIKAEPLWTVGTLQSLIGGTSKAQYGGHYYSYNPLEMLEVYANGGIWSQETGVKVTFY